MNTLKRGDFTLTPEKKLVRISEIQGDKAIVQLSQHGETKKVNLKGLTPCNSYGNKVGCHTPTKTHEMLRKFNRDIKRARFSDGSWHNDLTDCVYNNRRDIYIYLPNSENNNPENEEFNWFTIAFNHATLSYKSKDFKETYLSFHSADDVVNFLNKYIPIFDKNKKESQTLIQEHKDIFSK